MNRESGAAPSRAQREAAFHDARINIPDESRFNYAYRSVADVYRFSSVPHECRRKRVLEVGCFRGQEAVALTEFSGHYRGIDISQAAIEYCGALGLPGNFSFCVDDANVLDTVADASIDYAFGHGVLHHLELARFAPALARKLAPGGFARFVEPAQGNILLRTFRRLTPRLRTADEYPFDRGCIHTLERHFDVSVTHHALMRPYLPMLFLNASTVTHAARWCDDRLLRHRVLQDQAWLMQIEMRRATA